MSPYDVARLELAAVPLVLWGGSFFFAKVAVGELGPLTVVFGRVALAAVALNLVLFATGRNLFRRDAA
jgi:drug/metabolite transporter (DMT)-like permease